ncbi:hypothetical protein [Oceanibium sediminis]|uniref:hypothetical protein n=1 Tax=Oceanibium sediminis TaxID=2026339 RepID=UPI001300A8E7|nr:hypothetical protein [Oceanibium sediminis]
MTPPTSLLDDDQSSPLSIQDADTLIFRSDDNGLDPASAPVLQPVTAILELIDVGTPDTQPGGGYSSPEISTFLDAARNTDPGGGGRGKPDNDGDGSTLTSYTAGAEDLVWGDGVDPFNLTIDFLTEFSASVQQAFIDAADFIASLFTQGLADTEALYFNGGIFDQTSSTLIQFDDIRFTVEAQRVDGKFGILALAGASYDDSGGGADYGRTGPMPTGGLMVLDSFDIKYMEQNGLLDEVIIHEMFHILGVGTLWEAQGLTAQSGDPDIGRVFTGAKAIDAYMAMFTTEELLGHGWDSLAAINGVPIDETSGHWDEDIFGDALMTPFLNGAGGLTALTLASLEDQGYAVDPNAYSLLA